MSNQSARDLAQDPIIRGMTQDLIDVGIDPADVRSEDEGSYVFSAAMEYVGRGGDPVALDADFGLPAAAVDLAYEEMTGDDS